MGRLYSLLISVGSLLSVANGCKSNDDCWSETQECVLETGRCEQMFCSNEKNCSSPLTQCFAQDYVLGEWRGYCQQRYCGNCPDIEHVVCLDNSRQCDCGEGYRWRIDACASVLGLPCGDEYKSCDKTYHNIYGYNYICSMGICACNPEIWYQDHNGCQPYLRRQCVELTDCGRLSNTTCVGGVCSCSPGYIVRDDQCIWVLDTFCDSTTDCGGGNIICEPDSTVIGYFGKCRCPKGYALDSADSFTCKKVLDSFCSDIYYCGNASHLSYINDYLEKWSNLQWNYQFAHRAFYCNVENICKCAPGYKRTLDSECEPIYESFCVADNDCAGDTDSNSLAYKCNTGTRKCVCKNNYYSDAIRDQWHEQIYDWSDNTQNNENLCKPHKQSSV